MTAEKRNRSLTRWFRFGLRSALLGFTLLCLLLALVVLPYHRALREHRAVNELLANGSGIAFSRAGTIAWKGEEPGFVPGNWMERLTGIRISSHVKEVNIYEDGFVAGTGKRSVELLAEVRGLESVFIRNKDVDLKHLEGLRQLKSVIIQAEHITGDAPRVFSTFSELSHLALFCHGDGPSITDAHLSGLRNAKLESLQIASRRVDGSFLNSLESPQALRHLSLSRCAVDDRSVETLDQFRSLQTLELSSTSITDEGIEHLANLKNLRVLILDETAISDRSLEVIAGLSNLECLSLIDTRISDRGLASLARLPRLRILDVQGVALRMDAVDHLREFPSLERFVFGQHYGNLKELTSMNEIAGNARSQRPLTAAAVQDVLPSCRVDDGEGFLGGFWRHGELPLCWE